MAFQRIRIKNTNVSGKIPGADKLDTAELCINLKDQKLFSKDADGNVFEVAGGKVESGPTPPPNGNEIGDLFWDGDFLLVWNGSEWVQVGQSDLDYEADPAKGTITNTNGDDVDLPLVDDTNAGLMSPDEHKKLGDMPVIISGDTFPGTPSPGDIWFDTSDCPPTINIWDDCDDPGNPVWKPIGGGELPGCQQSPVQIIGDSDLGSTLTATGGGGIDEGSALPAPTYEWTGAKTGTGSTIVADVEGDYTVTATVTCLDGSKLSTSSTKTVTDSYVDMVNNTPPVIAVLGEGPDGAYEGNSIYVVTNATVINGLNPVIVENQWFKDGVADGTGNLYVIGAGDETKVITCRQLFRDDRTNELLSEPSNGITLVDRPADAITFTPVITDDETPEANTPGHVLTASAENIQGGTAAAEYAYEWKVGGLTMGSNKTLNLINTFVGQVVVCDITVAEPDGSNPETRTATYGKTIESGLKVGKGAITPNVDVEVGDTLTGSAAVTDAVGAVTEVHVWELDGSEAQRGNNATYLTTTAGTVRYRKEATDSHKTVIGDWSDPVIVTEPVQTGPNATMYGLRFDSTRGTKLSRSGSGTGTISYWKKDSSTAWVWQHEHQTGSAHPDEIGAGYDGYMSDYYFVDGQDLPADTFVGDFDGKTGPLDSSDVYENIGPVEYLETDEIISKDEVEMNYPSFVTLGPDSAVRNHQESGSQPPPNGDELAWMFDGQTRLGDPIFYAQGTQFYSTTNNIPSFKFVPNPHIWVNNDFSIWCWRANQYGPTDMIFKVNGQEVTRRTVDSTLQILTANINGGYLEEVEITFSTKGDDVNPQNNHIGVTQLVLDSQPLVGIGTATEITCATNKNFDVLKSGDTVTQSDNNATGIILTLDDTTNKIQFRETTGTWGPPNTRLTAQAGLLSPGFGANGFHLPFDPAATGAIYSNKTTTDLPIGGPGTVASVFNGLTADDAGGFDNGIVTPGNITGTFSFELTSSFTGATQLEIWGSCSDDRGSKDVNVYVDNGSGYGSPYVVPQTNPVDTRIDVSPALNGTTVEKIKIEWVLNNAGTNLSGIYINGKILFDYNNIGTDASGQDNHFLDENFAVGNTDEVWSQYGQGNVLDNGGAYGPISYSFNGVSNQGSYAVIGESLQVTLPQAINGQVAVHFAYDATAGSDADILQVVDNLNVTHTYTLTDLGYSTGVSGQSVRVALPGVNGLKSIEWHRVSSQQWLRLDLLEVDGEILIDKNIQDTVLDTPMKNYAVLESGSNGNLVATAGGTNLTYTGETGTDYYYEADSAGAIHTGGDPFSSTNGVTYNFGQQPFAAPNVTYDIDAGTVMVDDISGSDPSIDDSQVWSKYLSSSTGQVSGGANAFDNNASTEANSLKGVLTFDATDLGLSGTLELITAPSDRFECTVTVNGTNTKTGLGGTWIDFGDVGTINTISVSTTTVSTNDIADGAISMIKVGSKVLVDGFHIDPGTYSTLYQTWNQWARTALGYLEDRIAYLEEARKQDEATIAELRSQVEQALARIGSIESDEVNDDAVDTVLLATVADIITRVEALEGA